MKKLYALLAILIIAYVGINVACDNLPFTHSDSINATDANGKSSSGNVTLTSLDSFNNTKVNDTTVMYVDSSDNMTIYLTMLDGGKIEDIINNLDQSAYTSNQTIDHNGVTAFFLYNEGSESYSADIYFNKNDQNYLITGKDISYENSDKFINSCKSIIDSIGSNGNSGGFSRW